MVASQFVRITVWGWCTVSVLAYFFTPAVRPEQEELDPLPTTLPLYSIAPRDDGRCTETVTKVTKPFPGCRALVLRPLAGPLQELCATALPEPNPPSKGPPPTVSYEEVTSANQEIMKPQPFMCGDQFFFDAPFAITSVNLAITTYINKTVTITVQEEQTSTVTEIQIVPSSGPDIQRRLLTSANPTTQTDSSPSTLTQQEESRSLQEAITAPPATQSTNTQSPFDCGTATVHTQGSFDLMDQEIAMEYSLCGSVDIIVPTHYPEPDERNGPCDTTMIQLCPTVRPVQLWVMGGNYTTIERPVYVTVHGGKIPVEDPEWGRKGRPPPPVPEVITDPTAPTPTLPGASAITREADPLKPGLSGGSRGGVFPTRKGSAGPGLVGGDRPGVAPGTPVDNKLPVAPTRQPQTPGNGHQESPIDQHSQTPADNIRIRLPNGQTVLPGTTRIYQGHTITLSPSGTSVYIDGKEVSEFLPLSIDISAFSGQTNSNVGAISAWAIQLPNGEHVVLAPANVLDAHEIRVTSQRNGRALAVVDASQTISLGSATSEIILPTGGGLGGMPATTTGADSRGGNSTGANSTGAVERFEGVGRRNWGASTGGLVIIVSSVVFLAVAVV